MSSRKRLAQPSDAAFEAAAEWAARIDSGTFGNEDQAALDAWLAADVTHTAALGRMQNILQRTEGLPLPIPEAAPAPPREMQSPPRKRSRTYLWWPLAASGALAAVAAFLLLPVHTFSVATQPGQLQTLELSDGSTLTLRGDSGVRVDYGLLSRNVELQYGEAAFDVAHHPLKPFVLRSTNVQVLAVGTLFNVAVFDGRSTVTLIEGRVDVSQARARAPNAPRTASLDSAIVSLHAGQQVAFHDDGSRTDVQPANIEQVTAWQQGRIVLERRPLSELVDELNRTFPGDIRVDDPDLAAMTVNVSLKIDEHEVTLHRLEQQLPIAFSQVAQKRFVVVSQPKDR